MKKRKHKRKPKNSTIPLLAGLSSIILLLVLTGFLLTQFSQKNTAAGSESNKTTQAPKPKAKQKQRKRKASVKASTKAPKVDFETYMNKKTASLSGNYDISIYDVSENKNYSWKKGLTETMYTASIIKLLILVSLLQNHPSLSTNEQNLVAQMIRNSDNSATESLLFGPAGGSAALNQLFARLHLMNTKTSEDWWMSTTTSADQIELLKAVFLKTDLLPKASQDYIRSEMSQVNPEQCWGVGAFSDKASFVALKNGWRLEASWIMNSIGLVTINNKDYLIALLSDEHPYEVEDDGLSAAQNTMNQLAKIAGDYILS